MKKVSIFYSKTYKEFVKRISHKIHIQVQYLVTYTRFKNTHSNIRQYKAVVTFGLAVWRKNCIFFSFFYSPNFLFLSSFSQGHTFGFFSKILFKFFFSFIVLFWVAIHGITLLTSRKAKVTERRGSEKEGRRWKREGHYNAIIMSGLYKWGER